MAATETAVAVVETAATTAAAVLAYFRHLLAPLFERPIFSFRYSLDEGCTAKKKVDEHVAAVVRAGAVSTDSSPPTVTGRRGFRQRQLWTALKYVMERR